MTPQELKNSILQLAIQGKLSEQYPEDGEPKFFPFEGKKMAPIIPSREIDEEDKTLDLPEGWKWCRLADLATDDYINDGNWVLSKDMAVSGPVKLIQLGNIGDCAYKEKGYKYLTEEHFHELNGKQIHPGFLLINRLIGDKMLCCILPQIDGILMTAVDVCWIAPNEDLYDLKYIMYMLSASDFQEKVKAQGRGTTRFRISKLNLIDIAFPFPPLAEQKRIVAKIEELLPLLDRYETAWTRLEDFNQRFPQDIQKSILQQAIQGKLVEQRAEEGTGEELYLQIQNEKQKLIREGKIKKEKPLPNITDEEIPFEIPESWKWVLLGDISWYLDAGKSPNCEKRPAQNDEWGVITTTSIQLGFFDEKQNKVLPHDFTVNGSMKVKLGDILITRAGPTNRTGIVCCVERISTNLILSDKTVRVNMTEKNIYKPYIVMAMNSPQIRSLMLGMMSGMDKQQVNISQDKFKNLLLPLPPLAEQQRIVAKLNQILPLCEKLK